MEDTKLHTYFSETDFDVFQPHSGHEARFMRKLQQPAKKTTFTSWKWLSIAASIILFIGFYLGGQHQKQQFDLADVSPEMKEAKSFFVATINQELKEIEKHRNIETETMIEDALDEIEELEDQYKNFVKEISSQGNERHIIQKMIANYQQRLTVLEKLLYQLDIINNPTTINSYSNEII